MACYLYMALSQGLFLVFRCNELGMLIIEFSRIQTPILVSNRIQRCDVCMASTFCPTIEKGIYSN